MYDGIWAANHHRDDDKYVHDFCHGRRVGLLAFCLSVFACFCVSKFTHNSYRSIQFDLMFLKDNRKQVNWILGDRIFRFICNLQWANHSKLYVLHLVKVA